MSGQVDKPDLMSWRDSFREIAAWPLKLVAMIFGLAVLFLGAWLLMIVAGIAMSHLLYAMLSLIAVLLVAILLTLLRTREAR